MIECLSVRLLTSILVRHALLVNIMFNNLTTTIFL